jgi:hypothetical protein
MHIVWKRDPVENSQEGRWFLLAVFLVTDSGHTVCPGLESATLLSSVEERFFLPGEDDVLPATGLGGISVQRREAGQVVRGPGMAGRYVFACPQQGRADGSLLRLLQQCIARKTKKGRCRRKDSRYPGTGTFKPGQPAKLGPADPENLCSRPSGVPKVFRQYEGHCVYRKAGCHQKNSKAPGFAAREAQTTAAGACPACPYSLFNVVL